MTIFVNCRTTFVVLSVALVGYNIQHDGISEGNNNMQIRWPLESYAQIPNYLNDSQWRDALDEGNMWFMEEESSKRDLPDLDVNSASYKHQKTFASSAKALKLSSAGYINEFASRYARRKYKDLNGLVCNRVAKNMCEITAVCNKFNKFRSYDGSCNNLKFGFGVAFRPFRRLLPPDYADGK